MQYNYSGKTDIGLEREVNQDRFGTINLEWGTLFVVCDGFGHKIGGQYASRITVETLIELYSKKETSDIKRFFKKSLKKINDIIYYEKVSQYNKAMMGCTAVAVITKDDEVHIGHIGDSRAYLIRDDELIQLTKDHSYIQKLIDEGELTEEKAMFHARRHVLRKAIGSHKGYEPDYKSLSILYNDKLILCSDGVWGFISEKSILDIIKNDNVDEATTNIIEKVKNNMGTDNITIQVISFY